MEKISPVKGTRDFYPEEMALRNWIVEGWREASLRSGFEEYDAPVLEYLQLYTQKSGDEIVSQLFSLQDQKDRDLALRPEMTPSLARMINQKLNALPRPIKWFSLPRLFRYEQPQKGRLREFFQWNVDVIGSNAVIADAECIFTAVDYLRSIGLRADDVEVCLSSRSMLAAMLKSQGFTDDQLDTVYTLLDKRPKLPEEAFNALAEEQVPEPALREKLMVVQGIEQLDEVDKFAGSEEARTTLAELKELFDILDKMGIGDYCRFDIKIVRGLAYYTGPVYEIFDKKREFRAICGGGRYDNLLAGLGGQAVPATGFGMGDVVLEEVLRKKNLLGATGKMLDYFVVDAGNDLFDRLLDLVSRLRALGYKTAFDYRRTGMGKQLKQAASQNARFAVILGQETIDNNEITLKNMAEGTQATIGLDAFLANAAESQSK